MRKERKLPRLIQKTEDSSAEADGPDWDFMLVKCAIVAIATSGSVVFKHSALYISHKDL